LNRVEELKAEFPGLESSGVRRNLF